MIKTAIFRTIVVSGAICGVVVLQATAVAASLRDVGTSSSAPPTLLSDGLVTAGVDSPDLLRAIRDAVVNEKLLKADKKPFHLTAAEKSSPGGKVLAISTEPNDGGAVLGIVAIGGNAAIPSALDFRLSFSKKGGVAEDEIARRLAKLNAENRLKIYSSGDSIIVQSTLYLPEVATWNHIGRAISAHLFLTLAFVIEDSKSSSPVMD